MINLIPPTGYHVLKQEYLLRVGASFCFLIGSIFFVMTAALAPTYILTSAQIADYTSRVDGAGDESHTFAEAEREAGEAQILLAQIQKNIKSAQASVLIQAVTQLAPQGISLKTFSVQNTPTTPGTVQIQGVAKSRETLVHFKNAIEGAPQFEKAEVPIADLARDADLPFAITITLTATPQ
jgi:hypothetical protein